MNTIYNVNKHNGKRKIFSINPHITKTQAIIELYEYIILIELYVNFNTDLVRSCCIKYISCLKRFHLDDVNEWYYYYFGICFKRCKDMINYKIIESRLKIRKFISDHIWDLNYKIGRHMFKFRAEQDGIKY